MVTNLPDGEILARAWCLSKSSITDLVSTRIATNLPSEPTLPFLVITLVAGDMLDGEALVGESDFQFDAYAGNWGGDNTKNKPDYGTAFNIVNTVLKEAHMQTPSTFTSSGNVSGYIYGFRAGGIRRMDEEGIGLARYSFDATMTYRSLSE